MPDGPLAFSSAAELQDAYIRRETSPSEVTRHVLDRIARKNGELNAYITVTDELAISQAAEADRRYLMREAAPLLGVPISIKDMFEVEGTVTTYGSKVFSENISTYDSGAVTRLREAGAIFLGKTNTSEFGHSATTENELVGPCRNPWDTTRTAGGSSGGAAASVAAGLATIGLGSDGGGSIRIPGAFCGLVGVKPTIGLISNDPGIPGMDAFSTIGPLSRTVADARLLLEALSGFNYTPSKPRSGLRVAWCAQPENRPVDSAVLECVTRAVHILDSIGHTIIERDLPLSGWMEIFGPLVLSDEARHRAVLLDSHSADLTRYFRRTLEAASAVSRQDVSRAEQHLSRFREAFARIFQEVDLIVTPTTAVPAFPIGDRPRFVDGSHVGGLWGAFPFCVPFNVTGSPAATLPCGLVNGMPVGLQIIAAHHEEHLLLDVCQEIEEALGFQGTYAKLSRPAGEAEANGSTGD